MDKELDKEELLRHIRAAYKCEEYLSDSYAVRNLKAHLRQAEGLVLDSMPKKCCCDCCFCKNRG